MKVKLPNNRKQEDGAKKSKFCDGLVQLYFQEFIKLKPTVLDVSPYRLATEKHTQNLRMLCFSTWGPFYLRVSKEDEIHLASYPTIWGKKENTFKY